MDKGFAMTIRFLVVATILFTTVPSGASAPANRYATSNGTVYDNKTRLTWQQVLSSTTMTASNAATYCAGLNAALPGSWRVPTLKELQALVDYSTSTSPMIDSTFFPGTPSARFWSSSAEVNSSTYGWYVSFVDGTTSTATNTTAYYVRCVR
jgi:hypothetical protein